MQWVRLYTGADGRSHFEDLPLPAPAFGGSVAELTLATGGAGVLRQGTHADGRWQLAPRRQLVVTLAGQIEIEVGDGSRRRFGPGDVLLAEDTEGQGHRVRKVGAEERVSLSLPLCPAPSRPGGEGA